MRHVVVMTATGSIGLMAVFVVDFLNLFYISLLGERELAAAIGYAGTVLFFTTSVCIGVMVAGMALVSRALGARRRERARRLATSSLIFMAVATVVMSLIMMTLLRPTLSLLGATGRTLDVAWRFLLIVLPTMPILGVGMACSGLLRAAGDAKRAMYVTLTAGVVTALLDPLLIFGFGLGVDGAAITSIFTRLALLAVGLNGCIRIHGLLARPSLGAAIADTRPLAGIAVPAVIANVATPVGNAVVTAALAQHGDSAVAGFAVIGRISPLAFGAVFALSGSIGPILGQNLGARRFDRVKRALTDSLLCMLCYCLTMWALLVMLQGPIVKVFGATGDGAALIRFFCSYTAGTFVFVGMLFVANAAFNNLGFPAWCTFFNWGRATLGTFPFVWYAASYGPEGVITGQAAGSTVFGIAAMIVCMVVVDRLAVRHRTVGDEGIVLASPPIPPFTSGKAATAIDWSDVETTEESRGSSRA